MTLLRTPLCFALRAGLRPFSRGEYPHRDVRAVPRAQQGLPSEGGRSARNRFEPYTWMRGEIKLHEWRANRSGPRLLAPWLNDQKPVDQ